MKSSEFRRRFSSLTDPTDVTVHGHVIGTWMPAPSQELLDAFAEGKKRYEEDFQARAAEIIRQIEVLQGKIGILQEKGE